VNTYRTVLLVLHVLSAVIGIGATFTFGVLGSLQGRIQGEGALALLEAAERARRSSCARSGSSRRSARC
jgi:hypothetical protein